MGSDEVQDEDGQKKTVVQIGQKKKVFSGQNEQTGKAFSHQGDTTGNVHENPRRKEAFLISFQDKPRKKGVKTKTQGKDEALPLAHRVKAIPFLMEMVHGMDGSMTT